MVDVFPTELLNVESVKLDRQDDLLSIEVMLAPFALGISGVSHTVETSAAFDGIEIGAQTAESLAGRTLHFPLNPRDGYVEGSIYLYHAHHPVDLTRIHFEEISEGLLPARFETRMVLEFEGLPGYRNTNWSFEVLLPVEGLGV